MIDDPLTIGTMVCNARTHAARARIALRVYPNRPVSSPASSSLFTHAHPPHLLHSDPRRDAFARAHTVFGDLATPFVAAQDLNLGVHFVSCVSEPNSEENALLEKPGGYGLLRDEKCSVQNS